MATKNLSVQNFFTATLAEACLSSDTVIYLNEVPAPTEGYLVISPDDPQLKEIIYYTSVNIGSGTVTCPSVNEGRGVGGTIAKAHSIGETVKMNVNAEYWKEIQAGRAIADDAIALRHLLVYPKIITANTSAYTTLVLPGSYTLVEGSVFATFTVPFKCDAICNVHFTTDRGNTTGSETSVKLRIYKDGVLHVDFGGWPFSLWDAAQYSHWNMAEVTNFVPGSTYTIKCGASDSSARTLIIRYAKIIMTLIPTE